jgi:hypothetical protein
MISKKQKTIGKIIRQKKQKLTFQKPKGGMYEKK